MSDLPVRRRARVIVNPGARLASSLPTMDFGPAMRADIEVAHSAVEAAERITDAVAKELVVVIAGGDGSVHTAVNAIGAMGGANDVDIGIIPLGTANDLAHELRLPHSSVAAAWAIGQGRAHRADLLTVNGRRAVVGGGFGLPALCIETVQWLRARSPLSRALLARGGGRVYQAAAPLHAFPRPPHIAVRVEWTTPEGDTRQWDTHVIAGFFLNQRTVGRGLLLAPDAIRDDGCFELSFIMPSSPTKLLAGLWRVSVGKDAPGQVVVIRAVHAHLRLERAMMVFADGEDLGAVHDVDIGIVAGGVSLIS